MSLFGLVLLLFSDMGYATDWHVSTDLRERYQIFNSFYFNLSANKDTFELDSRPYLKAKADFGHGFSAYIQPSAIHDLQQYQNDGYAEHDAIGFVLGRMCSTGTKG